MRIPCAAVPRFIFDAAVLVVCLACASAPIADPTPEHPLIGCILPTFSQQVKASGKILPEPVRIIGEYEHDAEQWKVIRAGVYDASKWVPMQKSAIKFVGCGAQADAVREVYGKGDKP